MKEVKIIGLSINQSLGIVKACKLDFDENNKLIVIKGSTGQGKTTIQKGLQLGTQGAKTLVDKELYGEIDTEVQLLDGDLKLWVGCKTVNSKLEYVLYTKDLEGKKVKNPIIDGVSATPSKYLETLQTELTWRMDELTSENPTVQKTILLKLYQSQLSKIGVIFDKKHQDYQKSILGLIEIAENERNFKDALRKQKGGIADDLKAKGFDVDRPDTIPDSISVEKIDSEIKEIERQKTTKIAQSESVKGQKLAEIKSIGSELTGKCLQFNVELKNGYDEKCQVYLDYDNKVLKIDSLLKIIAESVNELSELTNIESFTMPEVIYPEKIERPTEPNYIKFKENQVLSNQDFELVKKITESREKYFEVLNESEIIETKEYDLKIQELELDKQNATEINKIVDAVDSFHVWRKSNETVAQLKNEYVQLLAKVDTGVEGLNIVPIDEDIFLMYNGCYDPTYFHNENCELRKLSSYSGTQKPVICLLIQNYLLNQKPKAMRYLYIDNIPIDNKTRALIEKMCNDLDLRVFLNITGDFEKNSLIEGEILVEGGECFFN